MEKEIEGRKNFANPVKSRFAKKISKNQHSPLDSANNMCYITYRTKKGEQKEDEEISPMSSRVT